MHAFFFAKHVSALIPNWTQKKTSGTCIKIISCGDGKLYSKNESNKALPLVLFFQMFSDSFLTLTGIWCDKRREVENGCDDM